MLCGHNAISCFQAHTIFQCLMSPMRFDEINEIADVWRKKRFWACRNLLKSWTAGKWNAYPCSKNKQTKNKVWRKKHTTFERHDFDSSNNMLWSRTVWQNDSSKNNHNFISQYFMENLWQLLIAWSGVHSTNPEVHSWRCFVLPSLKSASFAAPAVFTCIVTKWTKMCCFDIYVWNFWDQIFSFSPSVSSKYSGFLQLFNTSWLGSAFSGKKKKNKVPALPFFLLLPGKLSRG